MASLSAAKNWLQQRHRSAEGTAKKNKKEKSCPLGAAARTGKISSSVNSRLWSVVQSRTATTARSDKLYIQVDLVYRLHNNLSLQPKAKVCALFTTQFFVMCTGDWIVFYYGIIVYFDIFDWKQEAIVPIKWLLVTVYYIYDRYTYARSISSLLDRDFFTISGRTCYNITLYDIS